MKKRRLTVPFFAATTARGGHSEKLADDGIDDRCWHAARELLDDLRKHIRQLDLDILRNLLSVLQLRTCRDPIESRVEQPQDQIVGAGELGE